MDRYSSGEYLRRNPDWHVGDAGWKAARIAELLAEHPPAPRRVVEIGCGAGAVLAALAERLPAAQRLDGYDVSPQAIALARSRESERVHFHEGMADASGGVYDVALLIDVVEHVEDPFGFVRGVRELAERVVLHVPLDLSVQAVARARPLLRSREEVGHLHYFTKETALALVGDAGWKVRDWRYTAGTLDLPVHSTLARLARLPRRALRAVSPDAAARVLGGFSLLVLATRD